MDEEVRLLKESTWYSLWSIMFILAAFVIEVAALMEILKNNSRAYVLFILAIPVWLLSNYLRGKSRQYRRRADEVSAQ